MSGLDPVNRAHRRLVLPRRGAHRHLWPRSGHRAHHTACNGTTASSCGPFIHDPATLWAPTTGHPLVYSAHMEPRGMAAATNAAGCFVYIMHENLTYVATVPSLSSSSSTATAPPPAFPSVTLHRLRTGMRPTRPWERCDRRPAGRAHAGPVLLIHTRDG